METAGWPQTPADWDSTSTPRGKLQLSTRLNSDCPVTSVLFSKKFLPYNCPSVHSFVFFPQAQRPIGRRSYKPTPPSSSLSSLCIGFPQHLLSTPAAQALPASPTPNPSMGQDTSSAGDSGKSPSPAPQHRRGYQACDPCRKRKVKCDLGSTMSELPPHHPTLEKIKIKKYVYG